MRSIVEQIGAAPITLEFKPIEQPPLIKANATQMKEVLINLVTNAIQAMPNGGKLQITTDLQEELEGGVSRKYLLLVVSDTGCGMPAGVAEKLFTPFFTTKQGGRGLGLAFAKRAVEEQGGFMRCWSKDGIGTNFYVYLRIREKNAFDLARR